MSKKTNVKFKIRRGKKDTAVKIVPEDVSVDDLILLHMAIGDTIQKKMIKEEFQKGLLCLQN